MGTANLLGAWGEQLAVEFLRKKHYAILGCNFRCRMGEIDVIAKNRNYLVFVEVKLRKSDAFGLAREYVGYQKQQKIKTTAAYWLQANPSDLAARFDVIEIYAPEGYQTKKPQIIHLEDAFQ